MGSNEMFLGKGNMSSDMHFFKKRLFWLAPWKNGTERGGMEAETYRNDISCHMNQGRDKDGLDQCSDKTDFQMSFEGRTILIG